MSIPGGLLEPLQQHDTKSIPYPQWLQQWLSHLTHTPLFSKTPLQASHIHTPLNHAAWLHHLRHHSHQDLVQYFLQCLSSGFRVGFDGTGTRSAKNNLQSAVAHPTVVDDYIHLSCHSKGYLAHIYLLCVLMCILTDLGSSPRIINKISGNLLQIFLIIRE